MRKKYLFLSFILTLIINLPANKKFGHNEILIENPLVVHGEYIMKTDAAWIVIDSSSKLNATDDSIAIIQVSEFPDFTTLKVDVTLQVADLISGGTSDTMAMENIAPLPMPKDTLYIQWYIIGKNSDTSITRNSSFEIGWDRPVYTGILVADSTNLGDQMHLEWTAPQVGTDTVRVWWNTSPIPLSHDPGLPANQAFYPSFGVTVDTLYGLNASTLYYFGLQVFDDDFWSVITSSSSDTMKTSMGDTSMSNPIKIDSSMFNSATTSIELYWNANLHLLSPEFGYRSGYTAHPGLPFNLSLKPVNWDTIPQEYNVTTIPLDSNIIFDTSYAVGLWIRAILPNGSSTSPLSPTDSSTDTVKVHSIGIQEDNHSNSTTHYNFLISSNHGIILIHYTIPYSTSVKLETYDIKGKLVNVITDKFMQKGSYRVNWDSKRFGSGVYFLKLSANGTEVSKKFTIIK